MIDRLYTEYMALGNPHWMTADGKKQTALFKEMVAIDKTDPTRPKNGDRMQNGARL